MAFLPDKQEFTAAEAAAFLGVTDRRVRQLCSEGRIGREFGGSWIVGRSELEEFGQIERKAGRPPSV